MDAVKTSRLSAQQHLLWLQERRCVRRSWDEDGYRRHRVPARQITLYTPVGLMIVTSVVLTVVLNVIAKR